MKGRPSMVEQGRSSMAAAKRKLQALRRFDTHELKEKDAIVKKKIIDKNKRTSVWSTIVTQLIFFGTRCFRAHSHTPACAAPS